MRRAAAVLTAMCLSSVAVGSPSASAIEVGPFSYAGWQTTVHRIGETANVALFDGAAGISLSHGGANGVKVTDLSMEPGWGWSLGEETTSASAGPLTDEDVVVASGFGARGVYAVDVYDTTAAVRWESGVPAEARSLSFPYVISSNGTTWQLLAVDTTSRRPVAPGSGLMEDLLVEPRPAADGGTTLWGVPLDPAASDPTADAGAAVPLAELGQCPDLRFLVNDSGWLVHRCGAGPLLGRHLGDPAAEDVALSPADPGVQPIGGEQPRALLADGYLAYVHQGWLRLSELSTGEDRAVLELRGASIYPLAHEVSVARSGWALAAIPAGTQGETVMLTLSDGFRNDADVDPFEQWYAGRASTPAGSPVADPEQLLDGGVLPTSGGGVFAWDDGATRRVQEVHGAIAQAYERLGGPDEGPLGYPLTDELPSPQRMGAYNHFENGSIYWSPGTGAHEVHGAIRTLWAGQGSEAGFLGFPRSDETTTAGLPGVHSDFVGGSVYWTSATGAHEVHGAILSRWREMGERESPLRIPVTDERRTPDGRGAYNHFQGGSIYWTPGTGAHEVRGAILTRWEVLGWERSVLGFPTSGEQPTPTRAGAYSHFEGGSIYWSPQTGAASVTGAIRDRWASLGWENSGLGFPLEEPHVSQYGVSQRFQGGTIVYRTTGQVTVTYS